MDNGFVPQAGSSNTAGSNMLGDTDDAQSGDDSLMYQYFYQHTLQMQQLNDTITALSNKLNDQEKIINAINDKHNSVVDNNSGKTNTNSHNDKDIEDVDVESHRLMPLYPVPSMQSRSISSNVMSQMARSSVTTLTSSVNNPVMSNVFARASDILGGGMQPHRSLYISSQATDVPLSTATTVPQVPVSSLTNNTI